MKTTVKLKFRESEKAKAPACGVLVFHVTRDRRTHSVTTPYRLSRDEWSDEGETLVIAADIPAARRRELLSFRRKLSRDLRLMDETVKYFEDYGSFSALNVIERFRKVR